MQPDRVALEAFCREYELRTVGRTLSDYLAAAGLAHSVEQSLFGEETADAAQVNLDAEAFSTADLAVLRAAEEIAVGAVFSGTAPFVQIDVLALAYGVERRILRADAPLFDEVRSVLAERPVVLWNAKRYAQAGLSVGAHVFDLELGDYLLRPEENKRDPARALFAQGDELPAPPEEMTAAAIPVPAAVPRTDPSRPVMSPVRRTASIT